MAYDLVYEYAAVPQDDVYECQECIRSCEHVGDLECPSYRKYLIQSHNQEEPDPITTTCEKFVDWRDAQYEGMGYL